MAAYMDREQSPRQLQESAQRVLDYLNQRGLNLIVAELPGSTRTAQDAADNVGCSVAQIAKSIIFRNKKRPRTNSGNCCGIEPGGYQKDRKDYGDQIGSGWRHIC